MRIEWVSLRLDNWALWKARRQGHGLGFSGTSALMRMAVNTSGHREAIVPVDEVDASLTDQAVESLAASHAIVYSTVQLHYVGGLTVHGVAVSTGKATSTIKAHLAQADRLLAAWFVDRAAKRKALASRGRFTP